MTAQPITTTYAPGTLEQIPPGKLLLERNIRIAKSDDDLVASIDKLGVLEPITAVLNADGQPVVRFGHRRTLAAIVAGLETVPVYIAGHDDTADQAEVERIIAQHDENTQRAALSTADEVGVVTQLVAFGLSADDIAAQARIRQDRVATAITIAGSKLATRTAAKYDQITLDQAAAVAEFDGDPEVAKGLVVTAIEDPQRFAHVLQQRRDDRDLLEVEQAAIAELQAAGVPLAQVPSYNNTSKARRLSDLLDETGKQLTEKNHKDCPGHSAWVQVSTKWVGERRTYVATTTTVCAEPAKYKHRDRNGSSSSKPAAADQTDEEREKAKAERRLVIDNNKAWDSAEVVRREWLTEFARRKTAPPKGTAAFIAHALAWPDLLDHDASRLAGQWLGIKSGTYGRADFDAALKTATEARALHIALVQVLAGFERAAATKTAWRENGKTSRTGRYLRFLEACGYGLADVEKYATSTRTV